MNRYLLGKNLDVFTKIKIFLTNPNDNLKNSITLNSLLTMQPSTLSLKFFSS